MFRIKGHREAGGGLLATEWPLLAAAGQSAEFHTREEAERLVSMCNAALAHSPARITYAVEEAPEIRRVPIITTQQPERLCIGYDPAKRLFWAGRIIDGAVHTDASWPADDTGAPLTT